MTEDADLRRWLDGLITSREYQERLRRRRRIREAREAARVCLGEAST